MTAYRGWATAGATYRFVGSHLRDCVVMAIVPILFASAVLLAILLFIPEPGTGFPGPAMFKATFVVTLASWLVQTLLYVMFAVAWHRHYLLEGQPTGPFAILTWQRRHWRFAFKGVIVGVAFLIVGFLVLLVAMPVLQTLIARIGSMSVFFAAAIAINFAISAILYYLMSRFLLAFPAASVDDETVGLGASWDLTGGHSLQFFLALLLVVGPFLLLQYLASYAGALIFGPAMLAPSPSFLVPTILIQQVLAFVAIALATTAASITYRQLKAIDDADRAAAAAAAGPPDAATG